MSESREQMHIPKPGAMRQSLSSIDEQQGPLPPKGIRTKDQVYQQSLSHVLLYTAITAALITVLALLYQYRKKDPEGVPNDGLEHKAELLEGRWRFGLFDCLGDLNICCLTCCCPAIRWADTIRMAGFLSFWTGFMVFLGLQLLGPVWSAVSPQTASICGVILLIILVFYRQRQRRLFGMQSGTLGSYAEDCFTYCCCGCCAIIQEARHLEEAWAVEHVAVRAPRLQ